MAELTIQDVRQYLDDQGYTRWTDLSLQKVLTENGMWARLQTNYDATRAIDPRYITFPSMSAYATQTWVGQQGFANEAAIKSWVRSQGYITSVPGTDLTGYATQQWVLGRGFLTSHQSLADYATKQYADSKIIGLASQSWVSQNYATQAALNNYLLLSGGTLTGALTFANNTWNSVGDDCYIGDHNIAGGVGILGRNGNTRLDFCQYEHSETYQSIVFDGTNLGVQRWKIGECVITYDNGMLHFSHGIYSDGAVTAGGVGTSGGSGGGGLSWANLAASTTEQIALSHLTTALSGYLPLTGGTVSGRITCESTIEASYFGDWSRDNVTFFGNDAILDGDVSTMMRLRDNSMSISMQDGDTAIRMTGAVSLSSTLTASGQVNAKKFVATDYNSSDYLLTGDGNATSLLGLFSSMSVSGSTLYVTVGGTAKSVTLPTGLTSLGNRPSVALTDGTPLGSDYAIYLPLTYRGGGGYNLNYDTICSGYAKTTDLHSHTNKSVLDGITSTKVSNWDTAYGWGNHASAGYVTGYGNRPQIGNLSDSGVTWLPANAYVVMPLVYNAAGYYQPSYAKTSGNNTFNGTNTFNQEIYMSGTHSIVFNDISDISVNENDELELYGNNGVLLSANTVVNGTVTATGFVNSSDLRMKNLYGDIALSVDDIAAMPAVRFRWNSGRDTQAMHVGTIAQAWQTLLPEVVSEGSDGLLSMDYASAALVSVINVAKSVNDHERRILDLEAENRRLKTELEQLKAA